MKKLLVVLLFLAVMISCDKQNNSARRAVSGQQEGSSVPYAVTAQDDSELQKYALVMGNGNYAGITKLKNPVNDANDIAAVLQDLGFIVDKVLDGDLEQMEDALIRMKNRLSVQNNSYGFLFYAGHGVQSNGENYLIPVDAIIQRETNLRQRAVSVQSMLDELNSAGNILNVVVLDACRDNPFGWARSGSRGLSMVQNPPADSIIVYATSAGSTAADGTGKNGLFTGHLLKNLKTPGLEVAEIFRRTGADVLQASDRQQIPAIYNQFFGIAYLGENSQSPVPAPSASTGTDNTTVTPIATEPVKNTPVPPAPTIPIPANMVFVEGGTFTMGSPDSEEGRLDWEGPQHQVTVSSFYMGKYEVTQKEYQEVMRMNPSNTKGDNLPVYYVTWYDAIEYCNKRSLKEGLTPCYRGSGDDITCDWTANGYRLPTEAEWEYAAKGGNKEQIIYRYSGSNNPVAVAWYATNSNYKDGHWMNEFGDVGAKPVGSKAPNSLGIYDMSGNVSEWCWDLWGEYTIGAKNNPHGPNEAQYGWNLRVHRGGHFGNSSRGIRSAKRGQDPASWEVHGFRVVRRS